MTTRALVIVDVQNDFCEGGSLAVTGGAAVAGRVHRLVDEGRADYGAVVATQDWHVDPGAHFSVNPDYVDSWPRHCVAGTPGAQLHPALDGVALDAIVRKGEHQAAYSGFEGHTGEGTTLADLLRVGGIDAIDVVGIATDYCVRATALSGLAAGFAVRIFTDCCAGVDANGSRSALDELRGAGTLVTESSLGH